MSKAQRVLVLLAVCLPALAPAEGPALWPHDEMNNWGVWGEDDQRGAAN